MRRTVSVAVHWRGKEIRFHYMHFFTSSQKVCTRLQKNNAHRKKSQKSKEKCCQIALFSSRIATENLKPSTVLCFDLLIFPLKVVV